MRVHASILVQRPIAAVFAYLNTPAHLSCWLAGVVRADGPPPEDQEVGDTVVLEHRSRLGHVRSTWEVTAYEPPRSLALRGLDNDAGAEVRWTLEGAPAGATRIWVEADLTAVGFFQPAAPHLADLATRQVQADLASLRHQLEAGTSAS